MRTSPLLMILCTLTTGRIFYGFASDPTVPPWAHLSQMPQDAFLLRYALRNASGVHANPARDESIPGYYSHPGRS